jgi:hypothetical protein
MRMSVQAMEQVLERVVREPSFRDRIRESPARALEGHSLTPDERTVLLADDPRKREARGIDPRVSQVHVF